MAVFQRLHAQDDMDDVVEEEEWLQQVSEVYAKLSVQHPFSDIL